MTGRSLRQDMGGSLDQLRSSSSRHSDSLRNLMTFSKEFSVWFAFTRPNTLNWELVLIKRSISFVICELFIWQSMSLISYKWLGKRFNKSGFILFKERSPYEPILKIIDLKSLILFRPSRMWENSSSSIPQLLKRTRLTNLWSKN